MWPLSAIAGSRLRKARVAPAATAPVAADELRRRLRELGKDDAPIAVSEADGRVVCAWQLVGIPWATLLFRRKLRTTWALDLAIDAGRVRAAARKGSVQWETTAATWMPRAAVRWSRPLFPDFGAAGDTPAPPITADSPRDLPSLIAPVRRCVVEAGYAWEPTLEP
jgi:hypothetical protein